MTIISRRFNGVKPRYTLRPRGVIFTNYLKGCKFDISGCGGNGRLESEDNTGHHGIEEQSIADKGNARRYADGYPSVANIGKAARQRNSESQRNVRRNKGRHKLD